jgi:hypothetical protein
MFTFILPLSENLFVPLQYATSEKHGSIICILLFCAELPAGLLISNQYPFIVEKRER